MPLMISRIGHTRGRPVLFAAGRWGSITRHSLSVTSVWYRFVSRICCIRVVGVHMVSPGLVSATPWNHADPSHSTSFETASDDGRYGVRLHQYRSMHRGGTHGAGDTVMSSSHERIQAKGCAPGDFDGEAVVSNQPFGFWQGIDPLTGIVID